MSLREMIIAFLQTVGVAGCACRTSSGRVMLLKAPAGRRSSSSFSELSRGTALFARLVSGVTRRKNLSAHNRGILVPWGEQRFGLLFRSEISLGRPHVGQKNDRHVRGVRARQKGGISLQINLCHRICCRNFAKWRGLIRKSPAWSLDSATTVTSIRRASW